MSFGVLVTSGSFGPVYAVTDLLAGKERCVCEAAATCGVAEVALTRLRGQVDEDRHPKSAVTLGQAIAQCLEVAELEDTTRERYEDLIRIYITPTFGDLAAGKLDASCWRGSTPACSAAARCAAAGRAIAIRAAR